MVIFGYLFEADDMFAILDWDKRINKGIIRKVTTTHTHTHNGLKAWWVSFENRFDLYICSKGDQQSHSKVSLRIDEFDWYSIYEMHEFIHEYMLPH